jgi:hypothetical protein
LTDIHAEGKVTLQRPEINFDEEPTAKELLLRSRIKLGNESKIDRERSGKDQIM